MTPSSNTPFIAAAACAALLLAARPAPAQIIESVGTRALGMGGAFVALADDSTATWWNPAGLASGAFFSTTIERGYVRGTEESTLGVSFSVPSLGLSYYRVRVIALPPLGSTESSAAGRQDQGTVIPLPTYVIAQFGATVGQSVGEHLVLASTLKIARADNTKADVDIGAMLKFGAIRVGAVLKHLRAPELVVDGKRVGFDQQARVGAAYAQPPQAPVVFNAAVDADLTTTETAFGNVRHLAAGAEVRTQRLGIRTGVSVNTIDAARPAVSVGASTAVQKGTFIDARITRGDDDGLRGWGVDLRLTF